MLFVEINRSKFCPYYPLFTSVLIVVTLTSFRLPSVADFPNENASVTDRSLLSSLRSVKEKMESAVNSAQEGEASANFSQVRHNTHATHCIRVGRFDSRYSRSSKRSWYKSAVSALAFRATSSSELTPR